ncbi:MAG: UvrB/UvrC motif-containing protein, partial [Gemmatimonadales bacterium]
GQGWKGTLPTDPGLDAVRCDGCGATLEDFRDTGRLGCPECYRTFSGPLGDLLRRLHGATRHVGERYRAPGSAEPTNGSPGLERELRERLRVAVESENFELAAQLRDQLRTVK